MSGHYFKKLRSVSPEKTCPNFWPVLYEQNIALENKVLYKVKPVTI